jgi:uncharacterized peroxidase-related enzyme
VTWIETIDPEQAEPRLRELYRRVAGPDGQIDNILRAHSLRPRTLEGHLALYKAALHSTPASLDGVERELIGSCVSAVNGCAYCLEHHRAALGRRLGDQAAAERLVAAALDGDEHERLDARARAMLDYATKLTRAPADMVESDLAPLRAAGLDDATILELNQVVAYFAYANRTVLGLGVGVDGEVLGLHPPDGGDSLAHS